MIVYYDMSINDGGWTVVQRRVDESVEFYKYWNDYKLRMDLDVFLVTTGLVLLLNGSVDFHKYWTDYKNEIGSVIANRWPGNDNLHILTTARTYVIRFELKDFADDTAYAEYQSFKVANEATNYKVTFSGYTGTAGNAFAESYGMEFTSRETERDNDLHYYHCGKGRKGPWWFKACGESSLNGPYTTSNIPDAKVIHWATWRGHHALKATEMKIKPLE